MAQNGFLDRKTVKELISLRFAAFTGKPFLASVLLDSMTLEMNQMNVLREHKGSIPMRISNVETQIERRVHKVEILTMFDL